MSKLVVLVVYLSSGDAIQIAAYDEPEDCADIAYYLSLEGVNAQCELQD